MARLSGTRYHACSTPRPHAPCSPHMRACPHLQHLRQCGDTAQRLVEMSRAAASGPRPSSRPASSVGRPSTSAVSRPASSRLPRSVHAHVAAQPSTGGASHAAQWTSSQAGAQAQVRRSMQGHSCWAFFVHKVH